MRVFLDDERAAVAAAALLISLTACVSQTIAWETKNERIVIAPSQTQLAVQYETGSDDVGKQPRIDPTRSYAVSGNTRYEIGATLQTYRPFRTVWHAEFIHLIAPANTSSDYPVHWANGLWQLHLEFVGGAPALAPIDAKFRLQNSFGIRPN